MSKNKFYQEQKNTICKIYPNIKNTKVSFLFVTFNRAPNKDFNLNPLTWAFKTLLTSRKHIDEFVVVIDGSTDYTLDNLNWLKQEYKLNIKIIDRKNRKGCSFSRKQGIEAISNELFFMGDDDCLYSEDFVLGSLLYYEYIKSNMNIEPAIIAQPVFDLNTNFREKVDISIIGKTDFKNTWFYHNFDCKPKSQNEIKIEDSLNIVEPIEIETFKGVTLAKKSSIISCGNFLDLSMWANDYSEHIELSTRMNANNEKMFYVPDIRVSCIHLRFGSQGLKINEDIRNYTPNNLNISLGDMIKISEEQSSITGCRVNDNEFLFTKIGSFLSFYLKLDESIALDFIKMEYDALMENKDFETDQKNSNMKKEEKIEIWKKAIIKGVEVTEKQMNRTYDNFRNNVNKSYLFKIFN